jgi:hypothetical protein
VIDEETAAPEDGEEGGDAEDSLTEETDTNGDEFKGAG